MDRLRSCSLERLAFSFLLGLSACAAGARAKTTPEGGGPPAWFPDRPCSEASYPSPAERTRCYKRWTLLIYMVADNDLAKWALYNLAEMEAGGLSGGAPTASGKGADVVVQLDMPGHSGLRRIHVLPSGRPIPGDTTTESLSGWTAAPLAEHVRSPVIDEKEERDPGDPAEELRAFLDFGMRGFPAQHYLVALWGHGRGFGLAQTERPPARDDGKDPFPIGQFRGGVGFDWTQRTYLGVPTLRETLTRVVREVRAGEPIDVYLSDACLMQSVEVATELSGVARYLAGSTQVEDFLGTPYADLLARVNSAEASPAALPCERQKDEEACRVAHLVPEVYHASFQGGLRAALSPHAAERLTMSALRAGAIPATMLPAMAGLGRDLGAYLDEDPLENGIAVRSVMEDHGLGPGSSGESTTYLGNSRDIAVFLDELEKQVKVFPTGQERELSATARRLLSRVAGVREALDRTVISHRAGTGYPPNVVGFSVWLPPARRDYRSNRDRYLPSTFFQYEKPAGDAPGPWQGFLDKVWP